MNDIFNHNKLKKNNISIEANYKFIDSQKQLTQYLDQIMKLKYWIVDTETTGLNFLEDEVILLQIGNSEEQYVIDTRVVDIQCLADRLENTHFNKFLHNALFDYLMLKRSKGITMECMKDTMLTEKILTCGLQKRGYRMSDLTVKYLDYVISKEMQTSFVGHPKEKPFSKKQLRYAALDCVYPDLYFKKQWGRIVEQDLQETWRIENNAINAFGDMSFYGLKLDTEKWEQNIIAAEMGATKARKNFLSECEAHADSDLFGQPDINPASSSQVLAYLLTKYPEDDLKDRDGKLGTGAEILKNLLDKYDVEDSEYNTNDVQELLKIRTFEKKKSTYGYTYIDHINSITKRFHPLITQIGTDTGRPAGKKPNMLNIPAVIPYRHPWISGPGRKMITNDYGACELRIMASMSQDPVMCLGFNKGLDYHTYTAGEFILDPNMHEMTYVPHPGGEAGKGHFIDDIVGADGNKIPNNNFGNPIGYNFVTKSMRSAAKAINFGLAYGMGPGKLSANLKIPLELAKTYVKTFNTKFKVLVTWLKVNQDSSVLKRWHTYEEALLAKKENRSPKNTLGYITTFLGRRRYFRIPVTPREVLRADTFSKSTYFDKKTNTRKASWISNELNMSLPFNPADPWDKNLSEKVKKYYSRMAGIKREGGNSPIQGGNADITKIAMYELRKEIKKIEKEENNGQYVAHVALQVYDELVIDCPDKYASRLAKLTDKIMKEAGERVIKHVPVETGALTADTWVKG